MTEFFMLFSYLFVSQSISISVVLNFPYLRFLRIEDHSSSTVIIPLEVRPAQRHFFPK